MTDKTYQAVNHLLQRWGRDHSLEERVTLLGALLDAHVVDPQGIGTYALEGGERIFDAEKLLGVGARLSSIDDRSLNAVPLEWLESAPGPARLHVAAWLLCGLWLTWPRPPEHVERLRRVFTQVDPIDAETRGLVQRVLELVPGEPPPAPAQSEPAPAPPQPEKAPARAPPPPPPTPRGPAPTLDELLSRLRHPTAKMRHDAAWALSDFFEPIGGADDEAYVRIVTALIDQARRETDHKTLEQMLHNLLLAANDGDRDQRIDWDPLVDLLGRTAYPDCLTYILDCLGLAAHERYREAILPFVTHTHPDVRESAESAIHDLDHARAQE